MNTPLIFKKTLVRGRHVRSFCIEPTPPEGWIASEEADHQIVQWWRYRDWHRVERAVARFLSTAAKLRRAGWVDIGLTLADDGASASSS
jgi:hypothetical protein